MSKTSIKPVQIKRQDFLKGMVAAPLVVAGLPKLAEAKSSILSENPDKNLGFLYDSTKCIGCRACTSACHKANDMPPVSHEKPIDLSEKSRTTIRMFRDEKENWVYVKRQCMHCLNPACVSACPVTAMMVDKKKGMVYNDPSKCIGCRYCMVACPYDIISFEWSQAAPKIVKCTLCRDSYLPRRGITACVDFCSASALVFGNRKALLNEAKKRIKENPKRYINKVYGEKDGGGTNILYLAGKDFNELGFPANLGNESPAVITESIQAIYSWFIAPLVAFFLLLIPVSKNYSKKSKGKEG